MNESQNQLRNRVAIVTGATAGIGKSLVEKLVSNGVRCLAVGRRASRLEALGASLGNARFQAVATDIREANSPDEILKALPADWAMPDLLINNAGLALGIAPAIDCQLSDWLTMIDTNIAGLVRLTHRFLPSLVSAPRADIINLSSIAATYPYPGGNVYGATKAFVRQFSLGLRADLLGTNVRVSSIEPGMCETEFSIVRNGGDESRAKSVYAGMSPLTPDDIASLVLSVLSLPAHVNINSIEVMPTQQAFSALSVHRDQSM
ncbi:MAG: SDR family NAD(P)-dependent oxidoreductase [Pseudomonadota bacterium]